MGNKTHKFDKSDIFLIISISVFIISLFKFYKLPILRELQQINNPIKLTIYRQKGPIKNIFQKKSTREIKSFRVKSVNLKKSKHGLISKKLGHLGYERYFFALFTKKFNIKKEEWYKFKINCNGGLIFYLDGKPKLCFPFQGAHKDSISVYLEEGIHFYELEYTKNFGKINLNIIY